MGASLAIDESNRSALRRRADLSTGMQKSSGARVFRAVLRGTGVNPAIWNANTFMALPSPAGASHRSSKNGLFDPLKNHHSTIGFLKRYIFYHFHLDDGQCVLGGAKTFHTSVTNELAIFLNIAHRLFVDACRFGLHASLIAVEYLAKRRANNRIESELSPLKVAFSGKSEQSCRATRITRSGLWNAPHNYRTTICVWRRRFADTGNVHNVVWQIERTARRIQMAHVQETEDQRTRRIRMGRLVAFLSVTWWVVSVGGIIYVVSTT